jgi:hypothetical protein
MKLRYLDRCLLLEAKRTLFECCEMSANDPKRTLRTPRCASGSFCSNCVDSVRFDAIDPVFFEPTYIVGLYLRRRLRTHLVDCPTQSRPKCDGPPVIG